ncbi:MAG TPA: zinc-dependent alcohol dehydrogenase family protein [Terriglobales bacterium]|nr:zinc-dependent alcohol dehydrogenase family protein [Terriglobales bacterium]
MLAAVLPAPAAVESNPLQVRQVPVPEPGPGQVRVRVSACAVCRTDLHVVEGELPPRRAEIIPGHQIVGTVDAAGPGANRFAPGARVGVAWLHRTDGVCRYCRSGRENLCDAPEFTGYTVNGGFAEYTVAEEEFVYPLPAQFTDVQAAPLLCAGIIGFRCLRLADIGAGSKLGIYGFGAAGHVCIQVARGRGAAVYVSTRDEKHRELALRLGAAWVGDARALPPAHLDASIIFAPAGDLVPPALTALKKGGRLVLGGIHMSDIPALPYASLYQERSIRSVANNTREDGRDFLAEAAKIPVVTAVQQFRLTQINEALNALKHDGVAGAAVVKM